LKFVSAAIVKVAEAIEAIPKALTPEHLIARQIVSPGPSAPAEMIAGIEIPLRAAEAAAVADVGISLDLRNAGIDFAARALAFDIAAPIVVAEAERETAVIESERLGCGDACRSRNYKYGKHELRLEHVSSSFEHSFE
jgi:hypothetical protein